MTVYNEPHLRARVDLHKDPIHWIPAKDFNHVFRFMDLKRRGGGGEGEGGSTEGGRVGGGVSEVWILVEEEGNIPWDLDSEKPLYKYNLNYF